MLPVETLAVLRRPVHILVATHTAGIAPGRGHGRCHQQRAPLSKAPFSLHRSCRIRRLSLPPSAPQLRDRKSRYRSYKGCPKLRTHAAIGPFGRSIPRTFLGAVCVLNFEQPLCLRIRTRTALRVVPHSYDFCRTLHVQGHLAHNKPPPPTTLQ